MVNSGKGTVTNLLERAAEIDPEAWEQPLQEHLAARRSRSIRLAKEELSTSPMRSPWAI
jgi:hypothetical protein